MSMFSSFAQFLPSAIQNTITPHAPTTEAEEKPLPESNFDPSTDDEGDEEELIRQQSRQMDEHDDKRRVVKSKKEKDSSKMVSETFIFVRPPPSKTNHPLNLQVQLVPPTARAPSGISVPDSRPTTPTSAASVASSMTDGLSLSRTQSNRSDYSSAYASNSTTSFASYASSSAETSSTTSSSGGRSHRRIIPLYNLQAHNVLTNVIADAGTDAKIGKFQKKGLELIDLAVLEPVEVWGTRNKSGEKQARKQGMQISVDETGSIVHTGLACRPPNTASRANFLQPKGNGSRPGTPSANSSAVSLASNSSVQPQVTILPPSQFRDLPSPASAPPLSGTFPSSQLPRPSNSIDISPPIPQEQHAPAIVISPTSSKKPSSSSLFGKLKFNSKRNSALNPLVETSPMSSPQPQPLAQAQQSELAKLAMTTSLPADPASDARQPALLNLPLSPNSISSPNSATPTPTPTTPHPQNGHEARRQQQAVDDEDIAGDTPTSSPARPGFVSASGTGTPSQRTSAIGGAFSRGRNKFISGIKGAATASLVGEAIATPSSVASSTSTAPQQQHQQAGGAKGFFNKLAAGITGGERSGSQQEGPSVVGKRASGLFSLGRDTVSRESVDSSTSAGRTTGPFGKLLHHSSSQQFIGKGNGNGSSATSSVNPSPRPSHDGSAPPQPFQPLAIASSGVSSATGNHQISATPATPSHLQTFGQTPQIQAQQLTLRQLQLRPPVLGIQPTYVSASHSHSADQGTSAISITLGNIGQPLVTVLDEGSGAPTNPGYNRGGLSKVESYSTLGEASETATTSSIGRSGKRRGASKSRSTTTGTSSRRGSLDISMDKDGLLVLASNPNGSGASSSALAAPTSKESAGQGQGKEKEKERALMYVWLIAKWLKKRNAPLSKATSEHTQESSNGGGERPRAMALFRDILPGRDRDRGDKGSVVSGISGSDRELKRGSWHAGVGIGLLPNLQGHSQQPSNPNVPHVAVALQGQPLVLGPIVGAGVEVRFEWKRAKTRRRGRGKGDENDMRGRMKDKAREKEGERPSTAHPVKERDMAKEEEAAAEDTPRITQTGDAASSSKRQNRASTISVSSLVGDRRLDESPTRKSESSSRRSTSGASSKRRVSLLLKRKKDEDLEEEEGGADDGDEDDSDSEDSETPWVCTLKIRRVGYVQAPGGATTVVDSVATVSPPGVASLSSGEGVGANVDGSAAGKGGKGDKEQSLRLKVGTLSPTPHHPKVVAMLKVPFPLPDVEVERMKFVKRKGFPGAEEGDGQNDPYYGLTLTAEDIKDIVCSTGLWLVVRESIGGVGKVNRKGDGWKIRG